MVNPTDLGPRQQFIRGGTAFRPTLTQGFHRNDGTSFPAQTNCRHLCVSNDVLGSSQFVRRRSPMGLEPLRAEAKRTLCRGPQRATGAPSEGVVPIRSSILARNRVSLPSTGEFVF